MSAESILRELIAVRSDSGSGLECDMADKLVEIIGRDSYFQEHSDYYGAWQCGDILNRPVVWALKKGTGSDTLILSGHYDAVGIGNYGPLSHLACDPDGLMQALRQSGGLDRETREELESGLWLFGRGSNDMKGGLALNLQALFEHTPGSLNILLTAVCDEENLSAGARQAVGLYDELALRFGLEYVFGVVSEPSGRGSGQEAQPVIQGSAGKIMPVVVARGLTTHAARSMSGLNSATIIAKIADIIELNQGLVSCDKGINTHPPAVQILRDMKELYDASFPEYSAAAFNLTFLQCSKPLDMLEQIREMCMQGITQAVTKYQAVYNDMASRGMLNPSAALQFRPAVYFNSEVEAIAAKMPEYSAFRRKLREELEQAVEEGRETLQSATMAYLRDMMEFTGIPPASAVIGVAPPYYPAVNCDYLGTYAEEITSRLARDLAENGEKPIKAVPYSQGMTDLSYMSCVDPCGAEEVMKNIPLRGALYDVDFASVAKTNIPTVMIGPWGKGIHQAGERVYLPDLNENIPQIFRRLIALLARESEERQINQH